MTGKKHSILKAAIIITLIIALNLVGISYGFWQDSLVGEITANTGYIELSFGEEIDVTEELGSEESKLFSGLRAKLEDGDKTIRVDGKIKKGKNGEFKIEYSVFNYGSLPVIFDGIQVDYPQIDGLTIIKEPDGMDIGPKDSSDNSVNDSIIIQIDSSAADNSQRDGIESDNPDEDTPDAYIFKIVLPYSINSWADELTIIGDIEVIQPSASAAMPIHTPTITSAFVQDEIISGGLPDSPSDEELYDIGGSVVENEGEEEVGNEESGEDKGEEEGLIEETEKDGDESSREGSEQQPDIEEND